MRRNTCSAAMLQWLAVLFFSQLLLPAQAQEWKTYNVSNGLAHNDVRTIAVDGDFIWFGTHGGGLSRYQKSVENWTTFNVTNSAIISNFVQAVAIDGDQVLAGTDKGISRYRKSINAWDTLATINCITGIGIDWDDIWFTTAGSGAHRYEKSTGRWTVLDSTNSQLPSNTVTTVTVDGDFLWFGTGAGASRYRQSTGEMQNFRAASNGLASSRINAIAVTGDDVWFGHAPGTLAGGQFTESFLNLLSPTNCPPRFLLSQVNVKFPGGPNPSISRYQLSKNQWESFEISEAGRDTLRREKNCYPAQSAAAREDEVWLGSVSKGAFLYHKASGTWENFNTTNSGLAGDLIWAIAFDEFYVWIGTFNQGVSRYKAPINLWKTYRQIDGLVAESVEDLDVLGDEAWIATRRGVSRLQISTEQWTNFSFNSGIPSIFNWAVGADTNEVWVGPTLSRYQKLNNAWAEIDTNVSRLGRSAVYSIAVNKDDIWVGADHGKISRYHKPSNNWTLFDSTATKFQRTIGAIAVSGDGVWFGGLGQGAGYYNFVQNRWSEFDTSNSGLADNDVTSVGIDGDHIWFGTYGGGISRYHKPTNTWVTFNAQTTGQTVFLNFIWALAVDGDYVWFGSHSNGVYRYDKISARWENFNTLSGHLPVRRVSAIKAEGRCVWIGTFDATGTQAGGVSKYCDLAAPSLLHTPIWVELPSVQSVFILASIDDNVAVKSAAVNYRQLGMPIYKSAPLQLLSGDTWFGQIPGSDVVPGVMEYYLSATDGRNTTTHPFSSAPNAPHRFTIYDAVPPIVSPFVDSPNPNNFVSDFSLIDANIRLDGTGSLPTLQKMELMQYSDLAAAFAIDSLTVTLLGARRDTIGNVIDINGKLDVGDLRDGTKVILIRVTATDEGHDREGNPLRVTVLSNPLFTPTPSAALAQITVPDSGAIVKGNVTIKGTASHPNIKQFILSYLDSLGSFGVIASGTEIRENAVLGNWDTTILPDGGYTLRLHVEGVDGSSKTTPVPVVVDNTLPNAAIENLPDTTGGVVAIIGTASDKHFKMYRLEFGEGVNPASYQPLAESTTPVAVSDTLALWNTAGLNGFHSLRLRVTDQAGLETLMDRVLLLDNTGAQARILSPENGAVVTGIVEIRGVVLDANLKEYVVEYAASSTPNNRIKIRSATEQVSNGVLAVWDTQNLNGQFKLRLMAMDKTNAAVVDTVSVIVDNEAPIAEIIWPRDGAQVGGVVEIKGTADDANLKHYILEWGEGTSPAAWSRVDSNQIPVKVGKLALWDTRDRLGMHTLRLIVTDKVNFTTQAKVTFNIVKTIAVRNGGCIQSDDGIVELCLPPNCLSRDEPIAISPTSAEEFDPNSPIHLLSKVYEISPATTNLLKPGALRMTLPPQAAVLIGSGQKVAIVRKANPGESWQFIGGALNPERSEIIASVRKLGWFALAEDKEIPGEACAVALDVQPRAFSPKTGDDNKMKTNITLTLAAPENVTVKVYNPNGRLKAVLRNNVPMNRCANVVAWDGRDDEGQIVPSGLYVILAQVGGSVMQKVVMVMNN